MPKLSDYIYHEEPDGTLYHADCLDVMKAMPDNSIDTIITDPPYGLNFMGKSWDHGVPGVPFWEEALRVAKPGTIMLAFGGTRTFHRLMCAIEDAGWDIRDTIMWVYGSGWPKALDISKAIDKEAGAKKTKVIGDKAEHDPRWKSNTNSVLLDPSKGWNQNSMKQVGKDCPARYILAPATPESALWDGWKSALKPAWEPIVVCMKPTDGTFAHNALTHGVAGFNIDGARVGVDEIEKHTYPNEDLMGAMKGNCVSGKPMYQTSKGRYPANLIHDGSDEVMAEFAKYGERNPETRIEKIAQHDGIRRANCFGGLRNQNSPSHPDTGTAARFFYSTKAIRGDRNLGCEHLYWRRVKDGYERITKAEYDQLPERKRGYANVHPTVKPNALMGYLCKLTATPTGGIVLDPFMGSGSTCKAAKQEGRPFIGIEMDADVCEIAQCRVSAVEVEVKPQEELDLCHTQQ